MLKLIRYLLVTIVMFMTVSCSNLSIGGGVSGGSSGDVDVGVGVGIRL